MKNLTNEELESKFSEVTKAERRITAELIELLREVDRRRLYLEQGYGNLFDWMVRKHRFSQSAAHRRIQAARLLKKVPEIKERLVEGILTLSAASQAQGAFQREEKRIGKEIPADEKRAVLTQLEGKSIRENEKLLGETFPSSPSPRDNFRTLNQKETRLSLTLENAAVSALARVKELLSHRLPNASWSEIVSHLILQFRRRHDPLLQKDSTSAAVNPRVISKSMKTHVLKRAGGRCEFKSPSTGVVCGSRVHLEVDHIIPLALGGTNHPINLRALCRAHNLAEARRLLGNHTMDRFLPSPD